MQRLPLSSPAHAAALVAVGFPRNGIRVGPLHHTGTGEKHLAWTYEHPTAADAADLLRRVNPADAKALWKTEPAHPILAALAGTRNLVAVQSWVADPHRLPDLRHTHGGRLLHLTLPAPSPAPAGNLITDHAHVPHTWGTYSHALAAALIAAGFIPSPRMLEGGALLFRDASHLQPDLTAAICQTCSQQMVDPQVLTPMQLPGPFPPGQHPFQFAYAAAIGLLSAPGVANAAWRHPTHFFKGAKSATANDTFLRNPRMEQKLMEHISGV